MRRERPTFMIKLWDTLKNKTQQMLLEQENEELKWEQKYNKEHKLRQEAETETILVKGIGMNSPEMKAANKRIKELEKRIEELTNPVQKARESGLWER